MTDPKKKPGEIELIPDAWSRFERFIKQIVKAGPQHKTKPNSDIKARKKSASKKKKV